MLTFLALLVDTAMAVSSVLLIRGFTRARGRGPAGPVYDVMEVAFLNGGPARVVDTALTTMATDGRIAIGGPGIIAVRQAVAYHPVEQAVLREVAAAPNGALHHLRLAVMRGSAVQAIGDGLAARGLMADPRAMRPLRRHAGIQTGCAFLLFPAGIVLMVLQYTAFEGHAGSFPFLVAVLPAIFGGFLVGAICAAKANRKVTSAGRRAVYEYRRAHAGAGDTAHLIALNGLRAIADPVLQSQLTTAARLGRSRRSPVEVGVGSTLLMEDIVWCASSPDGGGSGGGGCGGANGSSCGGSGGCSGGCGGSSGGGSSCGGGGGSSCGGSSSSCGSSSASSCGGSSSS
ncbi:TIGR04222 domain-containing membrane protein [Streptomyces sp. SCSIO 30461]|uniref:TIGR04222 domain-containing membrane protein n=1 Tax=Streptomyces sp. SCSIO 30461 TaxID=3118085 RepID=UPI0030CEB739